MKTRTILFGLAMSLFVSCSGADKFTPIENGFGYVTHVKGITGLTDKSLSADLWYQDSNGKRKVVWPYLQIVWGSNIQITNNLAVLIGGKAELYDDGLERLRERLIAFESPIGPPLDITDQVLQQYCLESGVAFTNVIKDSFVSLTKVNDGMQMVFGIVKRGERGPDTINAHDASMTIPWRDIRMIVQDVKKTGKLRKEKRSGVEYLQKD